MGKGSKEVQKEAHMFTDGGKRGSVWRIQSFC